MDIKAKSVCDVWEGRLVDGSDTTGLGLSDVSFMSHGYKSTVQLAV